MRLIIALLATCATLYATEYRGMFVYPLTNSTEGPGLIEITNKVNLLVAAKCNTYLANVTSAHAVAVTNGTAWDDLTNIVRVARAVGIDTYFWYAPWLVKGPEVDDNPTWMSVSKAGVTNTDTVCLNRPEVRDWELGMLTNLIIRYPGLAGIHLEEPGYETLSYCGCAYCTNYFQVNYGLDITLSTAPVIAAQKIVYCAAGNDFVGRLYTNAQAIHLGFVLQDGTQSYNADTSERIGHPWFTWQTTNWTTRFCPQLYSTNTATVTAGVTAVLAIEPTARVVPSLGVVWSGGTNTTAAFRREVVATRRQGCPGWNGFRLEFVDTTVPGMSAVMAETYLLTLFNTLRIGP